MNSPVSNNKVDFVVKDMMTKDVVMISPDHKMFQAKEILRLKGISGMPVVDGHRRILGIVSVADIVRALEENKLDAPIGDKMSTTIVKLKPDEPIESALAKFRRFRYGRLPVVNDEDQVIGILTPGDIVMNFAKFLNIRMEEEMAGTEHTGSLPPLTNSFVQLSFPVQGGDFATAGEASGKIKKTLRQIGVNPGIIRRVAIAAYEAEMNIVIHADRGILSANITPEQIEIIADDEGPGIPDIDLAMQEGYSTAPDRVREMGFGAGMGLPNMKKCADEFAIDSVVGKGTKVRVVVYNR